MYEVVGADLPDTILAGDGFAPSVVVCCRGSGPCNDSDVVVAIDGEPVSRDTVQLPSGDCVRVTPPEIVVDDPGRHELTVTIGDTQWSRAVGVGPSRRVPDRGRELPRGACDG